MRQRTRTLGWSGAIVFGVLVAACSTPAAVSTPATPVPSATAPVPTAAPPGTAEAVAPNPTPIPPADRQAVLDFAAGHQNISSGWEEFHVGFDDWRQGLASCDPSSVKVALAGFSGEFVALTEAARGLPRDRLLRAIADRSVSATELEEEALRQLRDSWHPGDSTFFEGVDVSRASASALRTEVEDDLSDLQRRTSSESQGMVGEFSSAFSLIDSSWDEFDRSYDSFRTREPDLTTTEILDGLNQLVDEFRAIMVAVRKLPTSMVTRQVSSMLDRAADEEDLALRTLRSSFDRSDEPAVEAVSDGPGDEAPEEVPAGGPEGGGVTFSQRDPSLFGAFDARLIASNALRREALRALSDVSGDASAASRVTVAEFTVQYAALNRSWDAFHQDYDLWRVSEGGCDRAEVAATLGGFVLQFGELANGVRSLPGAVFLQPMGELFVEAAEREEEALRGLRSAWRPFEAAAFHALDQERVEARRLRRQVSSGLRELLARYDITAQEVERAALGRGGG